MIRRIFAVLTLSAAAAFGDWQNQLTPTVPGGFPLPRPVQTTYRGGWTAFSAADLNANFFRKADLMQLEVKGGTFGFVRTLWRLDVTHTARARAATLLPIDLNQTEFYSGKTTRTVLTFTPTGVTKFRESKPDDQTPPRRKRSDYPNLFDLHSAFLFVRSQPLRNGDVLNIVVYPATAPYLATLRVLGRENVQVKAGRYPAIKLELKLQRINSKLTLEPHAKFKRAVAWLSDDSDRMLLKVQADIFVGNIWAELTSAKFATRTSTP